MNEIIILAIFNIAAFGAAALLAYFFTFFLINLSHRFNFLDYPVGRKIHKKPIPFLGGMGIFMSFWFVVLAGMVVVSVFGKSFVVGPSIQNIVNGMITLIPKVTGIFLGGLLINLIGLLDDKFNLSPGRKFLGQITATFILMGLGLTINLFSQLGPIGYLITFIWILLIINAFNFIDSLDGHCVGVAFISSVMFFWITQILDQPLVGLFLATFAGALLGFFPHNFKPAKIFLGDNGSLFIGYMMAAFTLLCHYQAPHTNYVTIFIPILIFGVPIYDTISVILVRLVRGIAPWEGDRNHFAHRLVKMGMSERVAVIFSYFITFTIGHIAILTTQVNLFGAVLVGIIFMSVIGVIAFLEFYAAQRIRVIEKIAKKRARRGGGMDFDNEF